ncbi:hypothetical protein ACFLSE_08695 [Bacteroidota bacterium]
MWKTIMTILNDRFGQMTPFLLMLFLGGIYLYLDRPSVNSKKDIIEINGTLDYVEQVLTDLKKIKKTERDSTYHIHLNEFPCKFQVSYFPYDRVGFYKSAKKGDKIKLHIAKEYEPELNKLNSKIRSFSLTVNSKKYLSLENGLSGFGKGIFFLVMIFGSLIAMVLIIRPIIKKTNNP